MSTQPFSLERRSELVTEAIEKVQKATEEHRVLSEGARFEIRKASREKVVHLRAEFGDQVENVEILMGNRDASLKRLQWFEDRHAELVSSLREACEVIGDATWRGQKLAEEILSKSKAGYE